MPIPRLDELYIPRQGKSLSGYNCVGVSGALSSDSKMRLLYDGLHSQYVYIFTEALSAPARGQAAKQNMRMTQNCSAMLSKLKSAATEVCGQ
jgi:hypothetical protein